MFLARHSARVLARTSARALAVSREQRGGFAARVSRPAPHFAGRAVVDGKFEDVALKQYEGRWLVLFFYPLDFTFVCPTELTAFSDRMADFSAIDCDVVGCSTDSEFSHLAWINQPRKEGGLGGLKYPLLSDFKKVIANDYGVLMEEKGIALRGLFVINPDGVLVHTSVNDLGVGRNVDETLRIVQAFQFVAKHGEVCPAGWKPNSATIKPTLDGAKEYFSKVK